MPPIIRVAKRTYDYIATSQTNSTSWGCGPTPETAIQDLVLGNQHLIGAEIIFHINWDPIKHQIKKGLLQR